ncbi:MAG: decarboxylase [Planctomycetaceae bacterium]|nr:decarboxylase [Planctomycetaceae bacterium]
MNIRNVPDTSLELSGEQMQQLVDATTKRIGEFLDTLSEQPAWNDDKAIEIARSLNEPLPETDTPLEPLLDRLFNEVLTVGVNAAGPNYLAYVPGGGVPHAAVADLIASSVNRYIGIWSGAPGLAQLEASVLRWFADIIGYPPEAAGFFTSGGSLSIWSAIVTARCCKLPENFLRGTLYTSDQTHHSVIKAARFAGFPEANVRIVPSDSSFRIQTDVLREQIEHDRRDGWQPFAIVGHAGTTNTGAVDDLDELADIAQAENLWLHHDASYGGFFMLTERGRAVLRGIERADSVTLDPHKSLFMPYGTGCLLVRNSEYLKQAHQLRGDYMTATPTSSEFTDFCDISPELTRNCRGLRAWLPMKLHGIEPFRHNLDEKLDLAGYAACGLRKLNDELDDNLEIVVDPQLTVVAFRLVRSGLSHDELNQLNSDFRERINSTRKVLLTPTLLHGSYAIRICVLCFRTHCETIDTCLQEIRRAMREV